MRKKISSHPRFIKKLERDLKDLYYNEDYFTFIKQFNALQAFDFPTSELTELYYEALFNTGQNEEALFFAETQFQTVENDHEDNPFHMIMIIKALKNLGRYDEVEKWIHAIAANPYLGDLDPNVLLELQKIISEPVQNFKEESFKKPEFNSDVEVALTEGTMDAKLQAIEHLIDTEDETYVDLVSQLYQSEEVRVIQSMMISYLKLMDYNEHPIVLNKFGEHFNKYTSEFKTFEQEAKLDKTINWIVEIGVDKLNGSKEKIEQAIEMFINVSMLWYPYHVPFPPQKLANVFINYIRVLHNELDEKNFHGELAEWIFKIEDEMVDLD